MGGQELWGVINAAGVKGGGSERRKAFGDHTCNDLKRPPLPSFPAFAPVLKPSPPSLTHLPLSPHFELLTPF
eukprot:350630-Chlamydomonas_euryale.AAC.6